MTANFPSHAQVVVIGPCLVRPDDAAAGRHALAGGDYAVRVEGEAVAADPAAGVP